LSPTEGLRCVTCTLHYILIRWPRIKITRTPFDVPAWNGRRSLSIFCRADKISFRDFQSIDPSRTSRSQQSQCQHRHLEDVNFNPPKLPTRYPNTLLSTSLVQDNRCQKVSVKMAAQERSMPFIKNLASSGMPPTSTPCLLQHTAPSPASHMSISPSCH
jgi:hypothetical protein